MLGVLVLPQLLSGSSSRRVVRPRAKSRLSSVSGFSLVEVALTCFLLSIMTVSVLTLFVQVGSYQSSTRDEAAIADTVAQARATIMNEDACTEMMFGTTAGPANLPSTFNPLTPSGSINLATGIYGLKRGRVDPTLPLLRPNTLLPGQSARGLRATVVFLTSGTIVSRSATSGFDVVQYDLVARFAGGSGNGQVARPTRIAPLRIRQVGVGTFACAKFGEAGRMAAAGTTTSGTLPGCANGMRRFSLVSPTCL